MLSITWLIFYLYENQPFNFVSTLWNALLKPQITNSGIYAIDLACKNLNGL